MNPPVAAVLGPLVDIVDDEPDRRAGGLALSDAGQALAGVRLASPGSVPGLAGLAAVEDVPDVRLANAMPGGQPLTMQPIAGP